jgi:hypothetical protein
VTERFNQFKSQAAGNLKISVGGRGSGTKKFVVIRHYHDDSYAKAACVSPYMAEARYPGSGIGERVTCFAVRPSGYFLLGTETDHARFAAQPD